MIDIKNFLLELRKIGGEEIKKTRKAYGYTQQDIADCFGCNRSNISNKENGKIPITLDEYLAINLILMAYGPKLKKKVPISIFDQNIQAILDPLTKKLNLVLSNLPSYNIKSTKKQ